MDKLRIYFESFLMLIVSVNSILYLCTLKIKASFSSYTDNSSGSIKLILKQFKKKTKRMFSYFSINYSH